MDAAERDRQGMRSIIIVSGSPGSGKSTLSEALAKSRPQGLHFDSDLFYRFPTTLIDPTRPESRHQNTVIMRAVGRSARTFAEGGYQVILDGVVGPWFLPVLTEELGGGLSVAYVVLRVPEEEAVRRVRERQGRGASGRVRPMVPAFASLGPLEAHAIETHGRSTAEVLTIAEEGLRTGRFLLA